MHILLCGMRTIHTRPPASEKKGGTRLYAAILLASACWADAGHHPAPDRIVSVSASHGQSMPVHSVAQTPATPDSAGRKPSSPEELLSLVDQDGRHFSFAGLAKKTVLLNFIFTNCPVSCPAQTQALVGIQRALPPELRPRVRFVSVTIDPDRDTAQALKRYATAMGADLSNWSFVTGKAAELDWLQRYYAAGVRVGNNGQPDHQVGVYLLDARGRLMQRYAGDFDKPRLLREIGQVDALSE